MPNTNQISQFIQEQLRLRDLDEVTAVDAAKWLDSVGLLTDSSNRPGLPLRKLLRSKQIKGRQEANGRWYIDKLL